MKNNQAIYHGSLFQTKNNSRPLSTAGMINNMSKVTDMNKISSYILVKCSFSVQIFKYPDKYKFMFNGLK